MSEEIKTANQNAENADEQRRDDAVIEAFAGGNEADSVFRRRWEDTLQRAQSRRASEKAQPPEAGDALTDEAPAAQADAVSPPETPAAETPATFADTAETPVTFADAAEAPATFADAAETPATFADAAETPATFADTARPSAEGQAQAAASAAAGKPAKKPAEKGARAGAKRRSPTLGGLVPEPEIVEAYELLGQDAAQIKKGAGEKLSFRLRTRFSKAGWARFFHDNFPAKGDSPAEALRKLIMDVSFVVLVAALVYLGIYYKNYRARIDLTDEFRSQIENLENVSPEELDQVWSGIRASYPDVQFPEGMNVKFAHLYAISSDTVGWLNIPNTNISTVLLQTDNDYFYLYRDIYKASSRYGNPYVKHDCSMARTGLSKNTIIYGHNTHDGLMFHQLERYMQVEGYLNAPIITLDTLYETTKWKIFAVMLTNADSTDDNGRVFNYLYPEFSSESAFLSKMREVQQRSMIHTGVDVSATDKVLTLYTCFRTYFNSGRLIVMARQLRPGESEAIDPAQVYYDSTAIFPQAYYDRLSIPNPNASSSSAAPASQNTETTPAAPAVPAETAAPAETRTTAADTPPAETEAPQETDAA
ncbi:MAG: sortase [Clostridia bacterium]|nr:sortase [Clostridia bacterium]